MCGTLITVYGPNMIELGPDSGRNPNFPESEIPRLKANLSRQLAVALTQPQQIALEKFRAVLYGDHPYGRLLPTAEMITSYSIDQIKQFYQTTYGAGRSRLYIVGRFDPAAAETAVKQAFAPWGKGSPAKPQLPKPASTRTVYLVDRPGAVQSTLLIGLPVIDPTHADFIPLTVMDALLGGAFASRITKNIREDKGYTYSPYSELSTHYRG